MIIHFIPIYFSRGLPFFQEIQHIFYGFGKNCISWNEIVIDHWTDTFSEKKWTLKFEIFRFDRTIPFSIFNVKSHIMLKLHPANKLSLKDVLRFPLFRLANWQSQSATFFISGRLSSLRDEIDFPQLFRRKIPPLHPQHSPLSVCHMCEKYAQNCLLPLPFFIFLGYVPRFLAGPFP